MFVFPGGGKAFTFLSPSIRMRWPGLGRKAGAAPYVAIVLGIVSGHYIFNEPLKAYFAANPGAGVRAKVGEEGGNGGGGVANK